MTTIRALIVETSPLFGVTRSADRDQISKAIRQGGRRVWLDVSEDAPPAAPDRDWLAQVVGLPRVLWEQAIPFCAEGPLLALALTLPPVTRREASGTTASSQAPAVWISLRGSTLLTVHPANFSGWDAIFEAAMANGWPADPDSGALFYRLLKVLCDQAEQALDFASSQYQAMRADVFTEQKLPNYADMAIPVYRWQGQTVALRESLVGWPAVISHLYERLATTEEPAQGASLWPLMALATHLQAAFDRFLHAVDDSARLVTLLSTLPSGTQTKTTAALIEQMQALERRVERFSRVAWTAVALLFGILAALAILVLRGRGL